MIIVINDRRISINEKAFSKKKAAFVKEMVNAHKWIADEETLKSKFTEAYELKNPQSGSKYDSGE